VALLGCGFAVGGLVGVGVLGEYGEVCCERKSAAGSEGRLCQWRDELLGYM